jgi:hypothetical protein
VSTRQLFIAAALTLGLVSSANAWFVIFPIPNFAKPSALRTLIDRYSQSKQTKALAYVYERRRFGTRGFVWGAYEGTGTQEEANATALARCNTALEQANGKSVYDFDGRGCELHAFDGKEEPAPATALLPAAEPASAPASSAEAPQSSEPLANPSLATTSTPLIPMVKGQRSEAAAPSPAASATAKQSLTPPEARPSSAPPMQEGATTRKLRELNEMRKEGLISQKDYEEKKKAILRDF